MTIDQFFSLADGPDLRSVDRAVYLLWFLGRDEPAKGGDVRDLCASMERHGYPKQNVTRMRELLEADTRVAKAGKEGVFRLRPASRRELNVTFAELINMPRRAELTDALLPRELFTGSRSYIEQVVHQLNVSFDYGLYDCCAVMCRRLLETLLIEVYESKGRAMEIKGADGQFQMFAGLLKFLERDTQLHPSRNALKGLRGIKELGDLSAHNRRFVAQRDDIERVRSGLRVATGELLELAGLAAKAN